MTCKHVLALIDQLPLAELQPAQLEAAERHARDCPGCQSALAVARTLEAALTGLQEPAAPPALAAVIMARAARIDENRAAPGASRLTVDRTRSDRRAWVAALAGVAIGLGVHTYGLITGETPFGLTSSRIGGWADRFLEMPQVGPAVLVLGVGLLLYLVGLFAPIRDTGRN